MNEDREGPEQQLPLDGTGQRLRRAREAAGLTVQQLAAETRIPQRHIETIERGAFASLPSRTYATGFSRTYAKAVGLDADEVVRQLREELARSAPARVATPRYEPGDPARVPSRGLVWASVLAIIVLAAGAIAFYRSYWAPGIGPAPISAPPVPPPETGAAVVPGPVAQEAAGPVVFTALEDGVWVKFYEAGGRQLMQKQMARGERYVVPDEAREPRVWTGRPDALQITVGGRPVPPLAQEQRIVRDVPVTPEALLQRPQGPG